MKPPTPMVLNTFIKVSVNKSPKDEKESRMDQFTGIGSPMRPHYFDQ